MIMEGKENVYAQSYTGFAVDVRCGCSTDAELDPRLSQKLKKGQRKKRLKAL